MSGESCDRALLLQADFDGELDAAQSAALAAHSADCAVCRDTAATLAAARAVTAGATYHRASDALRRTLTARLDAEVAAPARPRPWRPWREAAGFGIGAALAAMLVFAVLPTREGVDIMVTTIVDDHVRALQPGHLVDVVSTDQHTVKPWFDGKLDFAPPVKDLAAEGFPLIGGRLDYVAGHTVAALAYGHGKHPINLLIWPDRGGTSESVRATHDGYNVIHWSADGMSLWCVSDLERDQLDDFVRLWKSAP
jgi:anti-sigma factor RsiW